MTPDEKQAYARQFAVHVGVDTAKQVHVLVALAPDGRRSKPFKVLVSRAGFEAAHAHLQGLFPGQSPTQMLIGLEFAGHHGFTFARFLADRGYPVVKRLCSVMRSSAWKSLTHFPWPNMSPSMSTGVACFQAFGRPNGLPARRERSSMAFLGMLRASRFASSFLGSLRYQCLL